MVFRVSETYVDSILRNGNWIRLRAAIVVESLCVTAFVVC